MHTGEAEERDGDYLGPAVNRAARVMAEFDSLRTVDEAPGDLPVQATSFVGCEVEVKEPNLVRANGLVTLTGVGWVGKTRLAVQVATESAGEVPDGGGSSIYYW